MSRLGTDDRLVAAIHDEVWRPEDAHEARREDSGIDEVEQFTTALGYHLPFLKGPRHLGLCTSKAVASWALKQSGALAPHPVLRGIQRLTFGYMGVAYELDLGPEVLR